MYRALLELEIGFDSAPVGDLSMRYTARTHAFDSQNRSSIFERLLGASGAFRDGSSETWSALRLRLSVMLSDYQTPLTSPMRAHIRTLCAIAADC